MSHAAYEEALAVYPHVPPATRAQVDAHLSSCAACAARLAEYQALQQALAARPAPRPSTRLRARFAAAVSRARDEDRHPGLWARLGRATLALGNAAAWAGVAAVTLLLLAGLAISGPQLARRAWPAAPPTGTAPGATPIAATEPAVTVARLERLQDLSSPPTFSPDGETYLTIEDGRVWLHSLASGAARELPLIVEPPAGAPFIVSNATWTPDGAAIVASQATEGKPAPLYLVDPKSGAARLLGQTYMPWRLRFDARGRLVVATETAFQTLDLASGDLADLPGVGAWFVAGVDTELAFSPDGRYLAALEGQELAVVDLATGARTLITTRIHPRWRTAFAWSPDGQQLAYATGERGGMPELWVASADGRGARRLATRGSERDIGGAYAGLAWLPGTSIIVYQFLPSGSAATLQAEYQAISAAGGPAKTLFTNGIGLTLSPNGRLLSFTRDIEGPEEMGNWVAVLEYGGPPTPTPPPASQPVDGWTGVVYPYRADPAAPVQHYFRREDGEKYAIDGSAAGLSCVVDAAGWEQARVRVWGRLLTGTADEYGRQIAVDRLEYLEGIAPPEGQVAFVAPGGRLRVLGTDGQSAEVPMPAGQSLASPAWSPDGRLLAYIAVSGNGYGSAYLFDTSSGHAEPVSLEPQQFLSRLAWSPNGHYLVLDSGSSVVRSLRIFEVSTRTFMGPVEAIGYAWSPDGTRLAIGRRRPVQPPLPFEIGDSVSLAVVEPGLPAQVILEGTADVLYRPLAWLPDGRILYRRTDWPDKAQGGQDSLWNARLDGQAVQTEPARDIPLAYDVEALRAHLPAELRDTASNFSWAPDGRWVAFQAGRAPAVGVYLLNTGTSGGLRGLADGTSPAWRPIVGEPGPAPTPDYRSAAAFSSHTSTSTSPDGLWVAEGLYAFPMVDGRATGDRYYTRLVVARADGSAAWTVADEWLDWGLGYTMPQPFHWSRDGRYLYFTNRPVPDGCGYFVNGGDLQRVDLHNGRVTQVAPMLGFWLALSPDERTLAAACGERLILRDLTTSAQREVALVPADVFAPLGKIVWAPDGSALVLAKANGACSPNTTHTILRVDVATLAVKTLVDADGRLLAPEAWPEPGRVLVVDKDKGRWWMDAENGALTPAG